jgi:hypothetical protein
MNKLNRNRVLRLFIQEVWHERNAVAARRYGATVYCFANDRIDGHWQIIDRLGVLQQLRSTT